MEQSVIGFMDTRDHPLTVRILKGMIFGCMFSLAVLLPFHYLYSANFDSIHDEFIVAGSDTSGFERSAYYFLSWMVIGYDTPPEATHQASPLSYFAPTLLAWAMVGGILAYMRMHIGGFPGREPWN